MTSGGLQRELEVVGVATFPRMTQYPGALNTGLGDGVLLPMDTFGELTGMGYVAEHLVRFRDRGAGLAALRAILSDRPAFEVDFVLVDRPQRPDALYGYDSTAGLRHGLAALLGGITLASLALGLVSSARGSRRELAVLRAVGMTAGGARSIIRWQTAFVAAIGLVVGLPLGVALGRVGWRALADHLGVPTVFGLPVGTLAAATVAALLVAAAISVPVAASATASRPAMVLRGE